MILRYGHNGLLETDNNADWIHILDKVLMEDVGFELACLVSGMALPINPRLFVSSSNGR